MIGTIDGTVFLIDVCEALFEGGSEAFGGEVKVDGDDGKEAKAG